MMEPRLGRLSSFPSLESLILGIIQFYFLDIISGSKQVRRSNNTVNRM